MMRTVNRNSRHHEVGMLEECDRFESMDLDRFGFQFQNY